MKKRGQAQKTRAVEVRILSDERDLFAKLAQDRRRIITKQAETLKDLRLTIDWMLGKATGSTLRAPVAPEKGTLDPFWWREALKKELAKNDARRRDRARRET